MMRINLPEEFVHRSWQELRPLAAPIGGAICAAVVITFLFRPAVAPGLLPRTDSATIVVKGRACRIREMARNAKAAPMPAALVCFRPPSLLRPPLSMRPPPFR